MGTYKTRQFGLAIFAALLGALPIAIVYASSGLVVAAQTASYSCTEVIGFSETQQWYMGSGTVGAFNNGGFIGTIPDPTDWQLRWYSGGSVDLWADPNFTGWGSGSLVTNCGQSSASPDRVVMNVSGNYNSDPNWWAQETQSVIQNIRAKYPNERQIALQTVVGGPNGTQCIDPATSTVVRAAYNYPYIRQGLAMDVGAEVVLGVAPQVRTCSDYVDNIGHLTASGAQAIGAAVAQAWTSTSAPPAATSTPPADVPPTATATPPPTPTPISPAAPVPGRQTITFDDLSSPQRPLTGQYPRGVIDWGPYGWYLSGPYGGFSGNSVSFNSSAVVWGSFTFVSPRHLFQFDASNGGTTTTSISVTCTGVLGAQQALASLDPGKSATILLTSITETCNTVAIGSTNGWATNFKNLVVDSSGGVPPAATSTPASTPQPTSTPAPTNTPTLTSTPTRSPASTATPTPAPSGSMLITFDDLSDPYRPLSGSYPTGMVDWGSSQWYLSGPWGQFHNNSVSFDANTSTATINLASPDLLVSLDAFNGGPSPAIVTLGCGGQMRQISLASNQLATITTNWTASCTSITISTSNGWNTNFKNLLFQSSAGSPPPTATASPRPFVVAFDDLSNPNRPLNGQYPTGVIDWGSAAWWLSTAYDRFTTKSISFNGGGPTSASFTVIAAATLRQVDIDNGGSVNATVSLSCAGQPTVTVTLGAHEVRTQQTSWTHPCTTIQFSSSTGWDTNFDNLVFQ